MLPGMIRFMDLKNWLQNSHRLLVLLVLVSLLPNPSGSNYNEQHKAPLGIDHQEWCISAGETLKLRDNLLASRHFVKVIFLRGWAKTLILLNSSKKRTIEVKNWRREIWFFSCRISIPPSLPFIALFGQLWKNAALWWLFSSL